MHPLRKGFLCDVLLAAQSFDIFANIRFHTFHLSGLFEATGVSGFIINYIPHFHNVRTVHGA
jgi:hypothetical protein